MKELPEYLEHLAANLTPVVKKTIKERIDKEAQNVFDVMKKGTPVSKIEHPHLIESLIKEQINDGRMYGWKISYDGYNEKGVPFQLIANTLNKGRPDLTPTRHIFLAIHELKGMDGRISDDVTKALDELNKEAD